MPNELTNLEFSLTDEVGGRPLTPETVDLPTLRGFLEEVETLIKGDMPGASLADSQVRIEKGSVKIAALVAALLASDARADLATLSQSGDLDLIQPRRAKVVEDWQKRARHSAVRVYAILPGQGAKVIRITSTSQFQHGGEKAWVSVEKYLTGKVVDLGGKQKPNVHLILADTGESMRVDATEQQLAAEKQNQLYKDVTLRVQGEQHLHTKALRNLRLARPSSNDRKNINGAIKSLTVFPAIWRRNFRGRPAFPGQTSIECVRSILPIRRQTQLSRNLRDNHPRGRKAALFGRVWKLSHNLCDNCRPRFLNPCWAN